MGKSVRDVSKAGTQIVINHVKKRPNIINWGNANCNHIEVSITSMARMDIV